MAVVALLAIGGLTPAAAAVPAPPVISNLSTATAGHVTGKVTASGAPIVHLALADHEEDVTLFLNSARFDLTTWGLPSPSELWASACNQEGCSEYSKVVVQPTDTVPDITWSPDDTVGSGQSIQVTADDSGGGALVALWFQAGSQVASGGAVIDQHETTEIATSGGPGTVRIERCRDANSYVCSFFSPSIEHDYIDASHPGLTWTDPIHVITQAHPESDVLLSASVPNFSWPVGSTFDLSWEFHTEDGAVVRSGTSSGALSPDQTDVTSVPIVGAGLPDGHLTMQATLTIHAGADYGDLVARANEYYHPGFDVAKDGPQLASLTRDRSTIYPRVDVGSYPGSVIITAKSVHDYLNQVQVVSSTGAVVRTLTYRFVANNITVTWNGKTRTGVVAQAGTYKLYPIDGFDNRSTYTTVVVSGKKLVNRTFRKDVSASGSLLDYYVGACSTLARPSHRGWARSLGFYANTRCGTQLWHASAVSTAHQVTVPAAVRYVDMEVSAYGGPVNGGIADRAVIRYLDTSGRWLYERIIGSGLTWHSATVKGAYPYVTRSHHVRWGFYTAYQNQYDVKSFRITVHYQVIG